MVPNPNGANGVTSDPREQVMWELYVKNNLQNAYQCAKKAGYGEDSCKTITTRDWFKERLQRLRRKDMLSKAEKKLQQTLDFDVIEEGKIKTDLLRIQTDVSKFIAERLDKDNYSNRTETKLSGEIGIVKEDKELDIIANEVEQRLKEKKLNEIQS